MKPYHPAKFHDNVITHIGMILLKHPVDSILDPMAGVGRIAGLRGVGFKGPIVANELEPEWARQIPVTVEAKVGDASDMSWAEDGQFGAIITSPTYGNRMADRHDAKDGSRRYTYKHSLGRDLTPGNTGGMQWGDEYKKAHIRIWKECLRVLRDGGLFVLNVKDHIRQGKRIPVSRWHVRVLERLGMTLIESHPVHTPGMRHGANRDLRTPMEHVYVLRKGEAT